MHLETLKRKKTKDLNSFNIHELSKSVDHQYYVYDIHYPSYTTLRSWKMWNIFVNKMVKIVFQSLVSSVCVCISVFDTSI